MIRGDVCYHTFKEPDKRRPALILTRTNAVSFLNELTIAPITTTVRNNNSSVWLDESNGMKEVCAINLDHLQTVPKHSLGKVITHLSDEKMREVFEAIRFAFGFD
ncbi:MAG: type II toxin-antitoxin system PemK/MazF family toxin [Acidobacteriota bacterium]|nr:type II toxin-antitoxin system PemK/MazF family toxin [Acidobacteriota bacterium]